MQDTNQSAAGSTAETIKGALRYIGDASYAILPEDVAHRIADLKKRIFSGVRWLVDKELEWIDERVEGGDRLREEWRQRRSQAETNKGEGI
jgi:hypothetical protein